MAQMSLCTNPPFGTSALGADFLSFKVEGLGSFNILLRGFTAQPQNRGVGRNSLHRKTLNPVGKEQMALLSPFVLIWVVPQIRVPCYYP